MPDAAVYVGAVAGLFGAVFAAVVVFALTDLVADRRERRALDNLRKLRESVTYERLFQVPQRYRCEGHTRLASCVECAARYSRFAAWRRQHARDLRNLRR